MEEQTNPTPEPTSAPAPKASGSDVDQNKAIAILGYIIPILFFIPLVTEAKKSSFAKYHANQHLVLLIAWLVIELVGGMVPLIGWFLILPLGTIALIVFAIMGIINASKGEMKPLPVIGGIQIIK